MDFVQFRAVCKLWSVIDNRFHPRRWILLPPPPAAGGKRRRLLNVTTRKLAEADQPEFAGHVVVVGSAAAPEGMLVLRDERTLVVRLLNPVTRHVVDLPSVRTLQRGSRRGPISRAFQEEHEVTAAGFANENTVVVYFGNINRMAVAKPGDARWTLVGGLESPLLSTATFQGRFYCIDDDHEELMVVDLEQRSPQLVVAADLNRRFRTVNMVDDDGTLMLVCSRRRLARFDDRRGQVETVIELFHVDLEEEMLLPIHSLDERAVFAGLLGAVLLPSTRHYRSVDPDTVYFRLREFQENFGAIEVRRRRMAYLPSVVEGRLAKSIASYICHPHT